MAKKAVDKSLLKALVPINALAPQHFNEIADKIIIEDLPAGRVIFKEGERDNRTVYLLAGEINLLVGAAVVGSLSGDTAAARHPLAPQQPRQHSAKTKTPVTIARIDTGLLDVLLTWDQSSGYEVTELEAEDEDWLSRMLQSQTFQKLPPANIQKLLMSMEEYPVATGNTVIKQGDPGDYYYIIKQGRCMVTRKTSPTAQDVKLAELSVGDSFGEDALISDSKRNATITMMTDGRLMRLAKTDFVALLREPLLAQVSFAQAQDMVRDGAGWLDVRLPGEFQQDHIDSAVNIPLSALRHRMDELDSDSHYIVYCDNGGRSSTAAFLLSQHGYDVRVLTGGTQALGAAESRAVHAQEGNTGRAEVINFDQEVQARKKQDDSAAVGAEARREANQLLAEARAQAEQLKTDAQQILSAAEQQAEQLRTEAATQLAQVRAAQVQLEQAGAAQQSEALAALTVERDAAQQRLGEMEAAHQQLVGQLAQLQQALQVERDRAEQLTSSAQSQSSVALEELRGELKLAQQEIRAAEQARASLAQELSSALASLRQIEQQGLEQVAQQQSEAQQRLEVELADARARLTAAQDQIEQTQQALQQQITTQDEKIIAMKARLESAREQVLEATHQKSDLEAARDAAQQRAMELQAELEQAQRLQVQLSAAEQASVAQQAARQDLERDVARLRTELEQARQGWRQQEDVQREELAAAQQLLAKSQAQAQALEQAAQAQQVERAAQAQQLLALQERLAVSTVAEQRVVELAAELDQIKSQRANLEEQQQRLTANHQAALADKESALIAQTTQLQAQLEQVLQDSAVRGKDLEARLAESQQLQSAEQSAAVAQLVQLREALDDKARQSEQTDAQLAQMHAATVALQQSLEAAETAAQAERAELQARIQALQDEAKAVLTRTSDQAAAKVAELQSQLTVNQQAAQQQAQQLQTQVDTLQQALVAAESDTQAQRDNLQSHLKTLQDEADARGIEFKAQLAETQQSAQQEAQARIKALQDEADAALTHAGQQADARVAELQAQLAKTQQSAQEEAQQLRAQADTLQQSLAAAQTAAQSQHDELQARIKTLQDEADAALTRTSKQAGERLAEELAKVRAELEAGQLAAQSEIAALRNALQQAEQAQTQEGARLESERTELQARTQSLEEKLDQANRARAEAESTATAFEQETVALYAEQKRLRATLEDTEQRAASDTAEQSQLLATCDALKADLQRANEQINKALSDGDEVEQARDKAVNEIARLKGRVQELEDAAQSEASGGKSTKKNTAALSKLRAEMAAAEVEAQHCIAALQAQLDNTLQQDQEVDARFARQQAQVNELEAQIDKGRRRSAELVQDVEDVKRQLEQQTQLRLAAETARKAAQQEAEGLRAESQIMSNLGEEHIEASAVQRAREQQLLITRLEGELLESKKNVEVAVRLRGEAESTNQAFEQELARIKEQSKQGDTTAPRHAPAGAGFNLRSGLGMGLAAGWIAALALGAYLALSGTATPPSGSAPVPTVAANKVLEPPPAIVPAPVSAPKPESATSAVTKPVSSEAASTATAAAPAAHALGTFRDSLRDGGNGPQMTRLPAGNYPMGSASNSLNYSETPRHTVALKAFAIGSYEVSFADYDRFATATARTLPSDHGWGRDNRPVINISWDDAVAYTVWLSEQSGHHYRLPSEAEWEYAAAAGTSTFYWWGNNSGENRAVCFNCGSKWDGRQTAPVGSFAANPFGLYDTAGNVLEWVADCRHESYQDAPRDGGIWAGGDCTRHIARGGSFDSPVDNLRTQNRPFFAAGVRLNNLGLRVVRED